MFGRRTGSRPRNGGRGGRSHRHRYADSWYCRARGIGQPVAHPGRHGTQPGDDRDRYGAEYPGSQCARWNGVFRRRESAERKQKSGCESRHEPARPWAGSDTGPRRRPAPRYQRRWLCFLRPPHDSRHCAEQSHGGRGRCLGDLRRRRCCRRRESTAAQKLRGAGDRVAIRYSRRHEHHNAHAHPRHLVG